MTGNRHPKHLMLSILVTVCTLACAHAQVSVVPCPEVNIIEKYDHIVNPQYQAQGWDTAVTCAKRTIELSAEPYIPVQFFNGTYQVDEIPFAPADPSFSQGTKMPISTDDDFSASTTEIPYPFYFFGIRKDGFRLGANGMITFATNQFGGGNACPYSFSAGLPWPNGKSGAPSTYYESTGYVPLGTTNKTSIWFRLMPNGDSIPLTTNVMDTNGYYMPMGHDPSRPTLTKAVVQPGTESRFVCRLSFRNANGDLYHLFDTINIGIDTINTMQLRAFCGQRHSGGTRRFDICRGQTADVRVEYTDIQYAEQIDWTAERVVGGVHVPLPDSAYTLIDGGHLLRLPPLPGTDTAGNHRVDTVYFRTSVDFVSGCTNYDTLVIYIHPTFDTTERYHICKGESFIWHLNNQTYTQTTTAPRVTLTTGTACDSVVHLDLTVYDVSHTTDVHNDCRPLTWLNGRTYTEDNNTDTMKLSNQWGCDSIVRLDFTIHPMTARLSADLDHFDYDHVDVVLRDETEGNIGRQWLLPTGAPQDGQTAWYTVPASMDTAHIAMVAFSPYGCTDTARISIPFHKENIWMPNAFTPDNLECNNRFGSRSQALVQQEMYIYDRYGRLVYRCEGVDCEWDGTDPDGKPCRQGAYAYIVRYTDRYEPNVTKVLKGTVTLIR